jgi:NAD+ kinase
MKKVFDNIILFGKRHHDPLMAKTLLDLKNHLEKKHFTVFIEQETANLFKLKQGKIIKEDALKEKGGLIIVIGGDGSLLKAARIASLQNIPVLGINRTFLYWALIVENWVF